MKFGKIFGVYAAASLVTGALVFGLTAFAAPAALAIGIATVTTACAIGFGGAILGIGIGALYEKVTKKDTEGFSAMGRTKVAALLFGLASAGFGGTLGYKLSTEWAKSNEARKQRSVQTQNVKTDTVYILTPDSTKIKR